MFRKVKNFDKKWILLSTLLICVGIGLVIWLIVQYGSGTESPEKDNNFYGQFLLKTGDGTIWLYDPSPLSYTERIVNDIYGITAFDYYGNNTIYYGTTKVDEVILSSSSAYPNLRGPWTKTALAVDFITGNIYILDRLDAQVYLTNIKGDYYIVLLSNLDEPTNIVLDPYMGLMFISQSSSILQVSMDGTNKIKVIENFEGKGLTIDHKANVIYFTSSSGFESYDYKMDICNHVANVSGIISLSVLEDKMLVLTKSATNRAEKILSQYKLVEKEWIYWNDLFTDTVMQDVKVYNTDMLKFKNPCEINNGGCEHICVLAQSRKGYSCACNEGWKLHSNGTNCISAKMLAY